MVHSIHAASTTFLGGEFSDVTFPQEISNCSTCHKAGAYNFARATARAVSVDDGTGGGGSASLWTDDPATTATAAVCGVCHNDDAAANHFVAQGAQLAYWLGTTTPKGSIYNAIGGESCAVCHGPGMAFDTVTYHNPGDK
jgi:OmcA/MtrC family decaheme c-type cytochrome